MTSEPGSLVVVKIIIIIIIIIITLLNSLQLLLLDFSDIFMVFILPVKVICPLIMVSVLRTKRLETRREWLGMPSKHTKNHSRVYTYVIVSITN